MDISKGFTIRGGQSVSNDLINYDDYIHIFNDKTKTYDLIHSKTGTVLKADRSFAIDGRANTVFDPMLGDLICHHIMCGLTLTQVSKMEGMPSLAVMGLWRRNNPAFSAKIKHAREVAAELFHDKIHDIANEAIGAHKDDVPGMKLATENYKWLAEKADPERFAKKKEEGNTNTAITINLRTGVHESRIADNIVVDEYGNFKGFNNGSNESRDSGEPLETRSIEDIELGTERYKIVGETEEEA